MIGILSRLTAKTRVTQVVAVRNYKDFVHLGPYPPTKDLDLGPDTKANGIFAEMERSSIGVGPLYN